MTQAYTPIQVALDTRLLTVNGISTTSPAPTGNFISENTAFSLSNIANNVKPSGFPTGIILVRSTLIPVAPSTETLGVGGYDKVSGIYAVDVMGPLGKGYMAVKQLADLVIAAFPRGLQLTDSIGNAWTMETTGMAPNITQGSWAMNKLYCAQVQVKWFGYATGQ